MRWLLDTNVISETSKRRPDQRVFDWLSVQTPDDTTVSIVTLAELRLGARLAQNERRRIEIAEWIDAVTDTFEGRVWPASLPVMVEWLSLGDRLARQGQTRDTADLLIAATAIIHDLIVVTRNTRDFVGTGVHVYDPWNDKMHRMEAVWR